MADTKNKALVFIGGIAITIMLAVLLFIPLPAIVLDILVAFNLIQAFLILLVVLYKKPRAFSSLPVVLLVSALFGLMLNITYTLLIWSKETSFDGWLIRAVSSFVTGFGSVSLGIFIVITAGMMVMIIMGLVLATKAARWFILDALPVKHKAIAADYYSGAISEEESLARTSDLLREAGFYYAMDDSSKWIFFTADVDICISGGNILQVIMLSIVLHGEPFNAVFEIYVSLAIVAGLLFLFPLFMLSLAAAITSTRLLAVQR